MTDKMLL